MEFSVTLCFTSDDGYMRNSGSGMRMPNFLIEDKSVMPMVCHGLILFSAKEEKV